MTKIRRLNVLTFSEQPLSGLITVSMVSEHLLKRGHCIVQKIFKNIEVGTE
jgi:hypothetical protein